MFNKTGNINKKPKKIWLQPVLLAGALIAIKVFSLFSGLVETLYSTGIYPIISTVLRAVTGWLPVSIGDLLYAFIIIWLLIKIVRLFKIIFRRQASWKSFGAGLLSGLSKVLWLIVLFNFLWALNYNRYGVSYQFNVKPARYTTEELKHITALLINKVNSSRQQLGDSNYKYPEPRKILTLAAESYANLTEKYPFLRYRCASVKPTLYGIPNNYLGILGYYNPFTGEAQVNTTVPAFTIPYTTCHEIAHQLGYGSESEANFVGYLAAKNSQQVLFQYSVYSNLFSYANGELFMRDSAAARANFRLLDTLVKQDYRAYRKFMQQYKSPLEPVFAMFYGQYLKANNQPKGIETYNEVIAWLIDFEKKYGNI